MKKRTKVLIFFLVLVFLLAALFFGRNNPDDTAYAEYYFRNEKLLNEHYEKHGIEMGFDNAEEYRQAACDVVNNKAALHKKEKEDNDDIYYLEDTNELVIVSYDGFLRTYFCPDSGKKYFDRQ